MTSPPTPVVLDTDVVISLARCGHLHTLGRLESFTFHVTEVTNHEVRSPDARTALDECLASGAILLTPLVDPDGLVLFGRLMRRVQRGEAAAIAQAVILRGALATHDVKGRKAASRLAPPIALHVLEDVFVEAVRQTVLNEQHVVEATARLVQAKDYEMPLARRGFSALLADPARGLRSPGAREQPSKRP